MACNTQVNTGSTMAVTPITQTAQELTRVWFPRKREDVVFSGRLGFRLAIKITRRPVRSTQAARKVKAREILGWVIYH